MSTKNTTNIENYRIIFTTLLWELLNTDCNPYYRWIWVNNMYSFLSDFLYYLNLEENLIRDSQVNILLEEFLNLIDSDIVFNTHFRKKSNEIIYEIKNNKKEWDYKKLKKNLEIIYKYLSIDKKYIRGLIWLLNWFIIKEKYRDENDKDYHKNIIKIKKLTFIFVILLRDEVWISRKYLDFLRDKFLSNIVNNVDQNFSIWLQKFTRLFFCQENNYITYFKIKIWDIQANKRKIELRNIKYVIDELKNADILYEDKLDEKLNSYKPKDSFKHKKDIFLEKCESTFYISIKCKGKDVFSVWNIAKEKINKLFDTFLYEFNALKLHILPVIILSNGNNFFVVDTWYSEYVNRKKWNEYNIISLNKILSNTSFDEDTKIKLSNSIKYYKLFLWNENPEVRMLNLWIALESLFSSIDWNEWAFNKLKSFLPKLLSMNLMKNYFDEFQAFILHRIDMENEKNSLYKNHERIRNIISNSNQVLNKNWFNEEKFNNVWIFKYFASSDIKEIEELMQNPYFIQKYNRLKDLINTDSKGQYTKLHTFLKRYENETRWLIAKIYRYRNYIVHWWKHIDTNIIINDLEFIYLELFDDIIDKIWCDYLYIYSLDEYFARINRSYILYDKWINSRIKDQNIWYKNTVLPFITY